MAVLSGRIARYTGPTFKDLSNDDRFKALDLMFTLVTADGAEVHCQGLSRPFPEDTKVELNGQMDGGLFVFDTIDEIQYDEKGGETLLAFLFGPKTAERIAGAFGGSYEQAIVSFIQHEDLFTAKVTDLKGIGPKIVTNAYDRYYGEASLDDLTKKFGRFGLTADQAVAILRQWHKRALYNIEQDKVQRIVPHISPRVAADGCEGPMTGFEEKEKMAFRSITMGHDVMKSFKYSMTLINYVVVRHC